jgi:hypothetical protein
MKKYFKITVAAFCLASASLATAGCFTWDYYFGSMTICCDAGGCEIQQI